MGAGEKAGTTATVKLVLEMHVQASLLCGCYVSTCKWGGRAVVGGSEKETKDGRKNGLQAKQSAQWPITHPEAAAIPYKACTHTS